MRRANVFVFLGLAHLLAWTLGFGYFALGGTLTSGALVLFAVIYMWTPAVAAVATRKLLSGVWFDGLGIATPKVRGLAIAWALPIALVGIAIAASVALPDVRFAVSIRHLLTEAAGMLPPEELEKAARQAERSLFGSPPVLLALSLVQVAMAGPTINAFAALGEELGWRGFMMNELRHWGFWPASLMTGVAWGTWHLPMIVNGYNYPGHPVAGPFMMIFLTVASSPLLSYVRFRGQSVFAAAVFHGTFNAAASLTLFLQGGHPLLTGITGMIGIATLLAANICLWLRIGSGAALVRQMTASSARF